MNIITNNRNKNGTKIDKRNTASYLLMGMFKPFAFNYAHNQNISSSAR